MTVALIEQQTISEPGKTIATSMRNPFTRLSILVQMFENRNGRHGNYTFDTYAEEYLSCAQEHDSLLARQVRLLHTFCEKSGISPRKLSASFDLLFPKIPVILATQSFPAEQAVPLICLFTNYYYQETALNDKQRASLAIQTIAWQVAMYKSTTDYNGTQQELSNPEIAAIAADADQNCGLGIIDASELKEAVAQRLDAESYSTPRRDKRGYVLL